MATEILVKSGSAITWNYGGTPGITLGTVANGAAAQGDKKDLGATRAARFDVELVIETATAPASAVTYDLHWAASLSVTAGTGNPGGCDGTNNAYTGTSGDSVADSAKQLDFIGALSTTSDANTVQREHFVYSPPSRYGMPVVVNSSAQTSNTVNTNHAVIFTPIIDESQ